MMLVEQSILLFAWNVLWTSNSIPTLVKHKDLMELLTVLIPTTSRLVIRLVKLVTNSILKLLQTITEIMFNTVLQESISVKLNPWTPMDVLLVILDLSSSSMLLTVTSISVPRRLSEPTTLTVPLLLPPKQNYKLLLLTLLLDAWLVIILSIST